MTAISKLPGWTITNLGSLGRWGSGGTPNRSTSAYYEGGDIPWLVIGDLNERVVIRAQSTITKLGLENSSAKLLPPGTLLVAMYGSIGKTAVTGVACATNQAIAYCIPHPGIDLRYLHRAVQWVKPALIAQGQGGAQQNISQGILKAQSVPLAPEREQKRIADKLDTVLTRVDAVNNRLASVIPILKRFRQSVLAAATSGRLTDDWRGHGQMNWSTLRADEACAKVQSGGTPKGGFVAEGIPFLKVYNIVDQKVAFAYKPQYVSADVHATELRKSQVQPGDVLMNIVGPPLGKVAIVPSEHSAWNINQAITLFRPSEHVSSQWIYFVLCEGAPIREVLNRTKGSVGQINISLSQCRAFELPVPPAEEQAEIVRRVETLFAFADRLEARLQTAQTATERLTPALLAKAFRGELVPQDPNDEPASELIKRLATTASSPAPKRGRKKAADAAA